MIRLEKEDFEAGRIKRIADIAGLAPDKFKERFQYILK
jgi:hypothetical protein